VISLSTSLLELGNEKAAELFIPWLSVDVFWRFIGIWKAAAAGY